MNPAKTQEDNVSVAKTKQKDDLNAAKTKQKDDLNAAKTKQKIYIFLCTGECRRS